MVQVEVIRRKQGVALIRWKDSSDVFRMGQIPESELYRDEGKVAYVSSPERSVPYGLPWAKLVTLTAQPESIEKSLRENGVWTYEDLLAKPNEALAAIQGAYAFDLAALRRAAEEYVSN